MTPTESLTGDRRKEITRDLRAPFKPFEIRTRIDGSPRKYGNDWGARVIFYVKRSAIEDRLDDVFGFGQWSYDWIPAAQEASGDLRLIKSTLTLMGHPYNDAGKPSKQDANLGCVSHGLKRVASEAGIGRYLAYLPQMIVPVTVENWEGSNGKKGQDVKITPLGKRMIRLLLERWDGSGATAEDVWEQAKKDARAEEQAEKRGERTSHQTAQAEPQPQQHAPASATRAAPERTANAAQAPASAPTQPARNVQPVAEVEHDVQPSTESQRASIRKLCTTLGRAEPDNLEQMCHSEAGQLITRLSKAYSEQQRQRQRATAATAAS